MPANRNNPGVHDTARQGRDREGALADYAAGMRSRSRLGLGLHGRPLLCRAPVSSGDAESALARVLQVLIQMAEAGELAGEAGSARGARGAARAEIAAAEEIAPGDHGGAHRAVLVGALRPG